MKFASPWSLVLLLVVPLWLWWEHRSAERGGLKFSSVATARSLLSFWAALGPSLLLLLRGATLVLFIVALARPQLGRSESKIKTEGIDIVLVIDISGSMQAMDYEKGGQRESRIDAVKDVVREFIRDRPNDRIGMVVFGTHAYVASPLTLDHDWLERNLDRVRIGLVEGNTAIGAGIGTGVNRLRDTNAKSKVIVLLTDGGENIKNPPALDAAKAAKEFNVRVYTVGAGSQGLADMPVYDRAGNLLGYQKIQADLDEDLLKQIAAAMQLLGQVHVGGLTADATESLLDKMSVEKGILKDPHFSVFVKEDVQGGVSVLGEVNKPGIYELEGSRHLLEIISAAGGVTAKAGSTVTVTRHDDPADVIKVQLTDEGQDPASNIAIYPGDTVVVTKAPLVYVVGEVQRPSGLVMENGERITVLQAIALAQGTTKTAKLGSSRIIRKQPDGSYQQIPLALGDMLKAKKPDIALQKEDILFIPTSVGRSVAGTTLQSAVQIAVGAAIYRP